MSNWSLLPLEILEIIFYYIGEDVSQKIEPSIIHPTRDMLRFQLICKHWKLLARSTYYKSIVLNSVRQTKALLRTLNSSDIGYLINYVHFNFNFYYEEDRDTITRYIFYQLACNMPYLKCVSCDFDFNPLIFKIIRKERARNRFLELEALPDFPKNVNSQIYYTRTAYLFKESLRELIIYDTPKKFLEQEEFTTFLNLDTLVFKITDWRNLYIIDKYISKCPTVKYVQIKDILSYYKKVGRDLVRAKKFSSTYTCPQVERVDIDNTVLDIRAYSNYLMNVFPNVKRFCLDNKSIVESEDRLPTDMALQYLHYLIKIPNVYVGYIPVKNINDTMIGLYDSSNTIKKLDIDYKKGHLNFLTLFNSTEANKYAEIYVGYQGSELLVLPLTGLIEKSGNKLQSLRINMDLKIDDMNVIANDLDKPDILTYVMSQCPNLKVINLWHAFLYCDDSSLFDIKPLSREIVYLVEALIHPAFFYGLSYYAPYIKKFIIANCNFTGNLQDSSNIFIDMPRTEFGSINCQDTRTRKDHIFLMLTTTINKKTVWYYGSKKNNYRICRESDYKNSLKDERCLSVFMRCKSTNAINIVSLSFDMSIKT